jgi:hypothetical protein
MVSGGGGAQNRGVVRAADGGGAPMHPARKLPPPAPLKMLLTVFALLAAPAAVVGHSAYVEMLP